MKEFFPGLPPRNIPFDVLRAKLIAYAIPSEMVKEVQETVTTAESELAVSGKISLRTSFKLRKFYKIIERK